MLINKFGLKRYIPEHIKREIRHRSKFACVVCRCAFYQYEHITPEFYEANEHNPEHMCLLCGHCHDKVSRGVLSKESVMQKYHEIQNSENIKKPFDIFDLNHQNIIVGLGSCTFHQSKTLISLNDMTILKIDPPEKGTSVPVLSGIFSDDNGNELFRINRNEWEGSNQAWDIKIVGNNIKIYTTPNKVALHIKLFPPERIDIVELDMRVGESHLILKENTLKVGKISTRFEYYFGIESLECFGADVGICVDSQNFPSPKYEGFSIVGGKGIELQGTGIKLAVGSKKMLISGISIEDATKQRTIITKIPLSSNLKYTTQVLPPRI